MEYTINFIYPINDETILAIINFIENHKDISKLNIHINSAGGSTSSGISIYNYLKMQSFPIATHNIGDVSSAAILLYLAGSTRTSEKISKFMIHPLLMQIEGNLPYFKIKEFLNQMDADIKNYSAIVNQETNKLNGKYNVKQYLKSNSIVFDEMSAYKCGIVTQMSD